MSPRDEKALRYIGLLDAARSDGNWSELPELVRKVTKHAPQRKCLIETAVTELEIVNGVKTTKSSLSSEPSQLSSRIPILRSAIEDGQCSEEERYQGQTCLGWVYWTFSMLEDALKETPAEFSPPVGSGIQKPVSVWTEICLVKATYIKGTALSKTGKPLEALQTFQSAEEWANGDRKKASSHPQLSYWSEQLLAQKSVTAVQQLDFRQPDPSLVGSALQSFRDWATFALRAKEVSRLAFGNSSSHLPRLSVWKAYYRFLSILLQHRIKYPSGNKESSVPEQSAEIRRVESLYENELLRSVRFPKATESNVLVEEWVEEFISNWYVLCGDSTQHTIPADDERNSIGRNVLEMLYRAASKTFHSTLILRRLFQVHKALADFDLAYKALDTYIELIERHRARAAKSEEPASGQDDDECVIRTLAEGIEGLCGLGQRDEAERAFALGEKLEGWIVQPSPESPPKPTVNGHKEGDIDLLSTSTKTVSPDTLEIAYRAIGIAQAQWAKWTPFSETRDALQTKAVASFQKAVGQGSSEDNYIRSTFALGMLLAERRDVARAIGYVKNSLSREASRSSSTSDFTTSRQTISLWHLLALLLTARQDFDTATQACAAAFEQFTTAEVSVEGAQSRASSLTTTRKPSNFTKSINTLVENMEAAELQRVLEIRITQLAITEVVHGPEDALNSSSELLGLFSRLFGRFGVSNNENGSLKPLEPPKSSSATLRSVRGSIFGRKKPEMMQATPVEDPNGLPTVQEKRPWTQGTEAPTIQVTDEDGKSPTSKRHTPRKSEDRQSRQHRRREGSFSKLIHSHSKDRRIEHDAGRSHKEPSEEPPVKGPTAPAESKDGASKPQHTTDEVPAPSTSLTSHSSPEATQAMQHNGNIPADAHSEHRPSPELQSHKAVERHSLEQYHRGPLGQMIMVPRLPKTGSQKYALAMLVKVWIVIATLYRRAMLFDDAREACEEAAQAAQRVETLTANKESSARAFAEPGWAGTGKSSDELWADVHCERAQLALSIARALGNKGPKQALEIERIREAVESFEQCLTYFPDHAGGIVGLSNILLDFYEKKINLSHRVDDGKPKENDASRVGERAPSNRISNGSQNGVAIGAGTATPAARSKGQSDNELRKTPENLNRLAARDRAYGLLSTLTKLGTGWDDAEAWFALARAHELGGEIDRAKDILWWCVELEDRRPIRHWRNLGSSGYVL